MHFISSNFSSAHFLDFENLHGHNFKVVVFFENKIRSKEKEIDESEKCLSKICNEIDHKILIPEKSKKIKIYTETKNNQIMVKINDNNKRYKQYVFPKEDVVILPIKETTAELIAEYLRNELRKRNINVTKVILEENDDSITILEK